MDDNTKDVVKAAAEAAGNAAKHPGGWNWQNIGLGTFSLAALMLGTYLILQTPNGNETAGSILFTMGAVFGGAWLYDNRPKHKE